jgi:hypothetical protein
MDERLQPHPELGALGGIGRRQAVAGGACGQQQREQGGGMARDGIGSVWLARMMIRGAALRKRRMPASIDRKGEALLWSGHDPSRFADRPAPARRLHDRLGGTGRDGASRGELADDRHRP